MHQLTTILNGICIEETRFSQSVTISNLLREAKWRVEVAIALAYDEQAAIDWRQEKMDQRLP